MFFGRKHPQSFENHSKLIQNHFKNTYNGPFNASTRFNKNHSKKTSQKHPKNQKVLKKKTSSENTFERSPLKKPPQNNVGFLSFDVSLCREQTIPAPGKTWKPRRKSEKEASRPGKLGDLRGGGGEMRRPRSFGFLWEGMYTRALYSNHQKAPVWKVLVWYSLFLYSVLLVAWWFPTF